MRFPLRKEPSNYLKPIPYSSFRYCVINSFFELLIRIYRILMTQVGTKNDEVEVKVFNETVFEYILSFITNYKSSPLYVLTVNVKRDKDFLVAKRFYYRAFYPSEMKTSMAQRC